MQSSQNSFSLRQAHPHREGVSPVTYMHKQTGLFLEWNLALQLLQKALGAKEDRYGESYEVECEEKDSTFPDSQKGLLQRFKDCGVGGVKERKLAKLHSEFWLNQR